ncbi:hypothetical protein NFHSH190041_11010 [Shewanella sp. NFH-SH190041]|uniref:hypothetical protein n=1 Tax=Shewanella sp. NFH-SH190041 TaxID=2950245 RepID=UPI0021C4567D|nr:hypothetical protein [Shewanella sp. NFH-SH190041]BDM63649.1 hypothetical protein NFHSH190041_11010 [Shewanella sp. NFH-SH190041]
MINRPLYETLPYAYLVLSIICLLSLQAPIALAFALLIFIIASYILILRSANRRTDPLTRRRCGLPKGLYEFLPYLYFGIALFTLKLSHQTWLQITAIALLCYALRIWLSRQQFRRHTHY